MCNLSLSKSIFCGFICGGLARLVAGDPRKHFLEDPLNWGFDFLFTLGTPKNIKMITEGECMCAFPILKVSKSIFRTKRPFYEKISASNLYFVNLFSILFYFIFCSVTKL